MPSIFQNVASIKDIGDQVVSLLAKVDFSTLTTAVANLVLEVATLNATNAHMAKTMDDVLLELKTLNGKDVVGIDVTPGQSTTKP